MTVIIGFIIVITTVFGGYAISGGSVKAVLAAMPYELLIIGGASIGSYIIANSKDALKNAFKATVSSAKGHKWHKSDYIDLFLLMGQIFKTSQAKGMMVLEGDADNPHESEIFKQYPRILQDEFVITLICDTMRSIITHVTNPYEVEDMMKDRINRHSHIMMNPADGLQTMADGLPAIGIVAAVLGVIKTMASVAEPPEVLGAMIGKALVGTFLGVFLSYCVVGPISAKIRHCRERDIEFYHTICDMFVYYMKGNPPALSIEIARSIVAEDNKPSITELEEAIQNKNK